MDLLDLRAVLTLDSSKFEDGIGKVKSGFATAAKIGVAAVGAATTAVGALTTKSVSAYGEYEQLLGGVQKLYGNMGMSLEEYAKQQGQSIDEAKEKWSELEEAQTLVQKNAEQAYKTAGMSMNEYMDTATGFSAALINSLGGDTLKAAEQTDIAMRAISDNFNTFGGDINNVRNAYMGFAKQNYTMLDNLKLGYGGTATEMQRLIDDANEYAKSIGQASDLSIESFSDIVTAIDLVQQKQNIAGTTAREASTTIQGSLGMVKAAWQNLLTGMADGNADIDKIMGSLVDSIVGTTDEAGNHINGLLDNVIPVVEKSISSISKLIEKVGPTLASEIPKILTDIVPSMISAGGQIVGALANGIVDNLLPLTWAAGDAIETLLNGILEATQNNSGSVVMDVINTLVGSFEENYMGIIDVGIQIINNVVRGMTDGIGELIEYAGYIMEYVIEALTSNMGDLMSTGTEVILTILNGITRELPRLAKDAAKLVLEIAKGISAALPQIIPAVVDLVVTIAQTLTEPDNLSMLLEAALTIMLALAEALIENIPTLIEAVPQIIENLFTAFVEAVPQLLEAGKELMGALSEGLLGAMNALNTAFGDLAPVIVAATAAFVAYQAAVSIGGIISTVTSAIKDATLAQKALNAVMNANPIGLIVAGITALIAILVYLWNTNEGFRKAVESIWNAIKDFIVSAAEAVEAAWNGMVGFFSGIWDGIKGVFSSIGDWFSTTFTNAKNKAVGAWDNIKSKFSTVWSNVKSAFSTAGDWFKTNFTTFKDKAVSAWDDIKTKFGTVWDNLKSAFHLDDALQWGKDLISNFINGIKEKAAALKEELKGVADKVKSFLGFSEPEEGPLSDFHTYAPDMMKLFAQGIHDNAYLITDAIQKSFDVGSMIEAQEANGVGMGGFNAGGITINVYAQDGQNARDVVDELEYRIARNVEAKKAVWGMS